ncbi:MAG TPA: hypothetical protein VKD69_11565 [Vicinamibacterales bacterium]|nr:hypothetical protein [Vicinamibacterales bacterium]
MKRIAIVALALFALGAQQRPIDESSLPPAEKRIPPGDYCKKAGVPISPRETRAHSCKCTFSCTVDANGNVVEREDASCQAFCHKNGRRCTCHVEEPCPGSTHGNAMADMDGHVVAVRPHH